jgi:Ni/Co efflux regulator RcnB
MIENVRFGVLLSSHQALIALASLAKQPSAKCRQALPDLEPITLRHLCPRNLRFGSSSHNQNETTFHRATAKIVRSGPATGFTTTAMTRFPSARSSGTTSAGFQPKSLAPSRSRSSTPSPRWFATPTAWAEGSVRLPETIRSREMRVPDWSHYPMNHLRKMTPPPLPPTPDK